ncbi:hypothetical protein ACHAWF_003936 [Thalassiosira exigua]
MAKKRKSKNSPGGGGGGSRGRGGGGGADGGGGPRDRRPPRGGGGGDGHGPPPSDDDSSSPSSSSDDDSLVLEGAVVRHPDASDSDDDDEESDEESDEVVGSESEEDDEGPAKKKAKRPGSKGTNDGARAKKRPPQTKKKKKKQQRRSNEPETIRVEFLFCDVHERYFHGLKTLLHRRPLHAPHSSQLADLMIENEMVGTVLTSDADDTVAASAASKKRSKGSEGEASPFPAREDADVFGFASIINLTANRDSSCVQSLKETCLKHCPPEHRAEMETVLSGKTRRPAGFFFHERMVNVPLEIVEVLHQQLVLDMDHAVESADDEAERKSLDFGAFVRLAPCVKSRGGGSGGGGGGGGGGVIYKHFDDEVFATNAEFTYDFEVPRSREGDDDDDDDGESQWCSVIVITKTGHRSAMEELKKMIRIG